MISRKNCKFHHTKTSTPEWMAFLRHRMALKRCESLTTLLLIMLICIIFAILLVALIFVDTPPKSVRYNITKHPKIVILGGTHGNEPAGTEALKEIVRIKKGHLVVIPEVNEFGLRMGTRWNFSLDPDINRNYVDGGRCAKSRYVMNEIKDADLVVDLHEGWGFHKINPNSIGSTISPTNYNLSQHLAEICVYNINMSITNPNHKFEILKGRSCEIKTSLACYCENNNIPYLLIETTGQNDVQPLETRKNQMKMIVNTILDEMKMV